MNLNLEEGWLTWPHVICRPSPSSFYSAGGWEECWCPPSSSAAVISCQHTPYLLAKVANSPLAEAGLGFGISFLDLNILSPFCFVLGVWVQAAQYDWLFNFHPPPAIGIPLLAAPRPNSVFTKRACIIKETAFTGNARKSTKYGNRFLSQMMLSLRKLQ